MPINCPPCPPCSPQEMKNALAIEKNTCAIASLTATTQDLSARMDRVDEHVTHLDEHLEEIIEKGYEEKFKGDIEKERDERMAADAALGERITTLDVNSATKEELAAEVTARTDAIDGVTDRIIGVSAKCDRLNNAEHDARVEADRELERKIAESGASHEELVRRVEEETQARVAADAAETESRTNADSEIRDSVTALETKVDGIESSVNAAIESERNARTLADEGLDTRLGEASAKITSLESALGEVRTGLGELRTDYAQLNEKVESGLSEVRTGYAELKEKVERVETDIVTCKTMIEDSERRSRTAIEAMSARISELEKLILSIVNK